MSSLILLSWIPSNLQLAYNENTFSIDFSVLEFSNPDRISYQYKIKELGDEWISTQPEQTG